MFQLIKLVGEIVIGGGLLVLGAVSLLDIVGYDIPQIFTFPF